MSEIVIDRCTLRVVRRGGWSWGTDPRRVLRAASEALPQLLAAKLGELLPADLDGELREPVRMRIPVRLNELLGASGWTEPAKGPPLADRLVEALRLAVEPAREKVHRQTIPAAQPGRTPVALLPPQTPPASAVLEPLRTWQSKGLLRAVLCLLPTDILQGLLGQLLSLEPQRSTEEADSREAEAEVRRLALELSAVEPRLSPLAAAVLLLVEAETGLVTRPSKSVLRSFLESLVPSAGSEMPNGATAPPGVWQAKRDPRRAADATTTRAAEQPGPRLDGDVRVPSALPWLVLGPLSRLGYFKTLSVALELADLGELAPCFGAALTYKVLDPPRRSWQRSDGAVLTAAACAGRSSPVPDPLLEQFSRRMAPFLSLLDADIASVSLGDAKAPAARLVWGMPAEAGGGLLLLTLEGLVPIAWRASWEEVLPFMRILGPPELLIPEEATDRALLAGIDTAGYRFFTPTPPVRGERWQRLRGGLPGRWWSNRAGPVQLTIRQHMAELEETVSRLRSVVKELAMDRRAIPLATRPDLEGSLTVAVGAALGTIAWTLWRDREPPDPLLALERFSDLEATVCFTPRSVRVRLPLGKRHWDLYEHGLLEEVKDVSWLPGRAIEFSGG